MTSPTVYKPSAYASVPTAPAAPFGNGYPGYPGFAPTASTGPAAAYAAPAIAPAHASMNVMAMCAFVSSLLGFGVISFVLGFIALSQIKTNGERGRGFAIAGIVIAAVAVVSVVLLCVALVALYQIGLAAGY